MTSGDLVRSGVQGLDYLLDGGFPACRIYLVHGPTGSGKTTLGMQFAIAGAQEKASTLYVTLAESREEIQQIAESHGWDIGGVTLFAPRVALDDNDVTKDQYTLFHPGEVELTDLIAEVTAQIATAKPSRVVIDSLAEIRLLARDPLILLRQMRLLRAALTELQCTVLLLNNLQAGEPGSASLRTFAHGIIELGYDDGLYGAARRSVSVVKLRGANPVSGRHDLRIVRGGLTVFPRLAANRSAVMTGEPELVESGSAELDHLCGGGLEKGSSAMIIGPAGSGKSTVASQYALAMASRGQSVSLFVFDESEKSCRLRWQGMNMPLGDYVDKGTVEICPVDPTSLSPGEFSHMVRASVENRGSSLVIIDSLSGYMQVMPESRFMEVHLFELLKYLNAHDVLSILIVTQHGILGPALDSPIDVSYLIDTILLMRFFEAFGEVHKAISVVKKRMGKHEKAIRECHIGSHGLQVGDPLREFQGVLSGIPAFLGQEKELL